MTEWWICYDQWPGPPVPYIDISAPEKFKIHRQVNLLPGDSLSIHIEHPWSSFNIGTMILNADGTEIGPVDLIENDPVNGGIKAFVHL